MMMIELRVCYCLEGVGMKMSLPLRLLCLLRESLSLLLSLLSLLQLWFDPSYCLMLIAPLLFFLLPDPRRRLLLLHHPMK